MDRFWRCLREQFGEVLERPHRKDILEMLCRYLKRSLLELFPEVFAGLIDFFILKECYIISACNLIKNNLFNKH